MLCSQLWYQTYFNLIPVSYDIGGRGHLVAEDGEEDDVLLLHARHVLVRRHLNMARTRLSPT